MDNHATQNYYYHVVEYVMYKVCATELAVIFLKRLGPQDLLSAQRSRQPEDHALTDCLLLRGKGQAKVAKLHPQYHSHPDDIRAPCCYYHYIT